MDVYIFETEEKELHRGIFLSWRQAKKKADKLSIENEYKTVFFYKRKNPNKIWDNHSTSQQESS